MEAIPAQNAPAECLIRIIVGFWDASASSKYESQMLLALIGRDKEARKQIEVTATGVGIKRDE